MHIPVKFQPTERLHKRPGMAPRNSPLFPPLKHNFHQGSKGSECHTKDILRRLIWIRQMKTSKRHTARTMELIAEIGLEITYGVHEASNCADWLRSLRRQWWTRSYFNNDGSNLRIGGLPWFVRSTINKQDGSSFVGWKAIPRLLPTSRYIFFLFLQSIDTIFHSTNPAMDKRGNGGSIKPIVEPWFLFHSL